ncbi:MAG TPA: STAS domain-containing protein [Gaiellales bacterium]|nr:STAS domain-containing protein [Gaiellales bacterium]
MVARAQLIVEVGQTGDGATVIVCEGELDVSTAPELAEAVAWSLTADLRRLRIDATKVSFCDSAGVTCLLDAACECRQRGVPLDLAVSSRLSQTLELFGLTHEDGSATGTDALVTELTTALSEAAAARITTKVSLADRGTPLQDERGH